MIFGGLEIVAGGYLIHRHYRKKNEKEKLEQDAQHRRNNTFPGASCTKQQQNRHQQANHLAQHHQQPAIPPQKYACYAPVVPQPRQQLCQSQAEPQANTPLQQRPHAPPHTQSFNIPRRPVPQRKPQIIIQPSLQRSDSFATLLRMPMANGTRPQSIQEQQSSVLPPAGRLHIPHYGPYGNATFSISTPAFGATPTSPGLTYEMAGDQAYSAGHTASHNWETYRFDQGGQRPHYPPTVSTDLGEYDTPPPPYRP